MNTTIRVYSETYEPEFLLDGGARFSGDQDEVQRTLPFQMPKLDAVTSGSRVENVDFRGARMDGRTRTANKERLA
jgi:hypothetical protein